jgi:hypothetical protein
MEAEAPDRHNASRSSALDCARNEYALGLHDAWLRRGRVRPFLRHGALVQERIPLRQNVKPIERASARYETRALSGREDTNQLHPVPRLQRRRGRSPSTRASNRRGRRDQRTSRGSTRPRARRSACTARAGICWRYSASTPCARACAACPVSYAHVVIRAARPLFR